MKHWKTKNEKFLLDIQTKCGDNANEVLSAAINLKGNSSSFGFAIQKLPYEEVI